MSASNPFVGKWIYRSLFNNPDFSLGFDKLELGRAYLVIEEHGPAILGGTIGGDGWSLALHGSFGFGSPMEVRFEGKGTVGGEPWIYAYAGWLVQAWPNSSDSMQRPAIVGSVTRVIAHKGSGGISPAGIVASFFAVRA